MRGNACNKRQMAGKYKNMRSRRCGHKNWAEVIQAVESCLTSVVRYRLATSKYFRLLTHDLGLNPEYETDSTIFSFILIKNPQGGLSHRYSVSVGGPTCSKRVSEFLPHHANTSIR